MTVTIEEGKFYRNRAGRKVGPTKAYGYSGYWQTEVMQISGETFGPTGRRYRGNNYDEDDLVAEWTNAPVDADLATETFAPLETLTATEAILAERGSSHGDWKEQAGISQRLKELFYQGQWAVLRPDERESLEMIAVKISRILSGNPHFEDHWRDIAGYATLAADRNKAA